MMVRRCAIYTRKSTEEGLEQDFNSLDAQREACAAYILSQKHEGWTLVDGAYDDGGYSGGSMERPGLKALLADVAAGKIDVIVVYKVDRLTRSLADFAKIVEILDARSASFVSVTQAFNTTTSMGRLTLNVLLSFAQFEREVTGERIRDKIAASKAKGMWMGGPPPLGYNVGDRRLEINPAEAATVRHIFQRFLELGSGRQLVAELDADGIRSKPRTDRFGKAYGNARISRGALYVLLQNRTYVGEVVHKGQAYPGQHEAIIERPLFDAVQAQIASSRAADRLKTRARHVSPLSGMLRDVHGRCMSPTHAQKGSRRYRYYVSQTDGAEASAHPCWRISAPDVESHVVEAICALIGHAANALSTAGHVEANTLHRVRESADARIAKLRDTHGSALRALLLALVERIDLSEHGVDVTVRLGVIDTALEASPAQTTIPLSIVRSDKRVKLILPPSPDTATEHRDPALVRLVVQALSLRDRIATTSAESFGELADRLGFSREYASALLRIAYLAPDILTAILEGRQPRGFTRTQLIRVKNIPLDWPSQRTLLGFA